jgi:hypothetical protein
MRSDRSWRLLAVSVSFLMFGCTGASPPSADTGVLSKGEVHLVQNPTKAQARAWLASGNYQAINAAFSAVQAEYRVGTRSDESLYVAFLALYDDDEALGPAYDGWVRAYPGSYVALLARGIYHRKLGQNRRGGATIGETTDAQLQGMEAEYKLALHDLNVSKALDARALLTLSNELDILANYSDAASTRAILEESKKIDPGNIVVRRLYLSYLEPLWGGSEQQMTEFVQQSQTEGLPAAKLRSLEAVIVASHAHTAEMAGDDATAEREYRQAIEMADDECSRCLGLVLVREQKFADSIPVLTRAIERDPTDKELLYWRAVAYLTTGSNREGFADMLEAANLGAPYAKNRVAVFYLTGLPGVVDPNPDAAVKLLRECAAQGNVDCTHNLQIALHGQHQDGRD